MDNQMVILLGPDSHINALLLPCMAQILSWSPDHYFDAAAGGELLASISPAFLTRS
ncbi:MAG: hypothetical protein HGA43_14080, partial [Nitrospirae bacterium]|nr:hypothetical protein [Nitrospirota bacterium]